MSKTQLATSPLSTLLSLTFVIALLVSCMPPRPNNLGVTNGSLTPCPETPNCVCSQSPSEDTKHSIAPMPYSYSEELIREKILEVLNEMARTKIVTASDNYFYVESNTLLLRFTDDFEVYIDDREKLLHFRSASRIGHSDLGTNKRRVEAFKKMLSEKLENYRP